ncbi:hypothetical protein R3P38DRAFT_2811392 [Favolaschia claudopus]|uniref:Uncharacterized protein n=1 Tax=Favolaschia claudopus TaxID=2862362 RepID=A0AAV9Z9Q6_9AGAR
MAWVSEFLLPAGWGHMNSTNMRKTEDARCSQAVSDVSYPNLTNESEKPCCFRRTIAHSWGGRNCSDMRGLQAWNMTICTRRVNLCSGSDGKPVLINDLQLSTTFPCHSLRSRVQMTRWPPTPSFCFRLASSIAVVRTVTEATGAATLRYLNDKSKEHDSGMNIKIFGTRIFQAWFSRVVSNPAPSSTGHYLPFGENFWNLGNSIAPTLDQEILEMRDEGDISTLRYAVSLVCRIELLEPDRSPQGEHEGTYARLERNGDAA